MNQGLLMWFSLHLLTSASQMSGSGDWERGPYYSPFIVSFADPLTRLWEVSGNKVTPPVWVTQVTPSGLETSAN